MHNNYRQYLKCYVTSAEPCRPPGRQDKGGWREKQKETERQEEIEKKEETGGDKERQ